MSGARGQPRRVRCIPGFDAFAWLSNVSESGTVGFMLARLAAIFGLTLALLTGCGQSNIGPTYRLTLAGAQIPTELVTSWLSEAGNPAFAVELQALPTWSIKGFQSLARGECDVACTDRTLGYNELSDFGEQPPVGTRIGFYGYGLYVHPENPLDSVFAGHLGLLFQKKITDWKELAGGAARIEGPINLYGPRKSSRGGDVLMRQAKIWFSKPTWKDFETDDEIVAGVAADPLALGFAAIGRDQAARYLGLRMERTAKPAFPSLEEIESERYGLAKVIYVYYVPPATPAVAALIEYLQSAAGAAAMNGTGVWAVPRERASVPPPVAGS